MNRQIERFNLQIGVLEGKINWDSWKKRLLLYLERFPGALELIQGRLVEPVLSPESVIMNSDVKNRYESDLKFYTEVNNYVLSALLFNMKQEIYQRVKDFKSGRQIWLELDRLFDTSQDEVYKLCEEFFKFKKQDNEDLITHIVKLKNHWNKVQFKIKRDLMTHCVLPDFLLIGKLLDSLPLEYADFKSTWHLLPKADKTFENFISCLCAFERAQLHKSLKESREARKVSDMKHEDTEESDEETAGSIPDISLSRITLPTETVLEEETENDSWFVDVAATSHITFKKEYFTTFKPFTKGYHEVITASGDTLDVEGMGTVQIEIPRKGCKTIMTLEDVLYVPSIRKNLFSVIAAQEALPDSLFVSKTQICILAAGNGLKITGLKNRSSGLFRLAFNIVQPVPPKEENISDKELLQLYHERLGHQSKQHIAEVVLRDLGYKVSADREFCEGCYKEKGQRASMRVNNLATRPGELIFADICGPFRISASGFRYFVLFKDVYSEYRIVYFIKQKSEVIDYLKKLLAEFKKLNYSVREFLSSSEEFNNISICEILSKQGIKQRFIMPHEQNGIGECEKLLDTARALMRLHSVLPQSLWDEMVNTSSYILNLTAPTRVLGKTPIELWLKIKPNIEHLRVIGSTGYSNHSSQINNNVENSIILGKLVGYSPFGCYKLWNEGNNCLIQTNDVIFTEEILISNPDDQVQNRNDKESTSGEKKKFEDLSACNSNSEITSYKGEVFNNEIQGGPSNQGTNNTASRNVSVTKSFEDLKISVNPQANRIAEPESYSEAVNCDMWCEAMEKEMNLLKQNKTWELVELPPGHNALPTQWVYKAIMNPDGTINTLKAKVVAKGFWQKSQAFRQTFGPASRLRAMLCVTSSDNLLLTQLDIATSTFIESIEEPLFVEQPEGYNDGSGRVWKLKRSPPVFKGAPNKKKTFIKYLLSIGFFKYSSDTEDCLFKRIRRGKELYIRLQDDGLVAWRPTQHRKELLDKLQMELKSIIQDSPDHSRFQLLVNRSEYIKTLLHRMMSGH